MKNIYIYKEKQKKKKKEPALLSPQLLSFDAITLYLLLFGSYKPLCLFLPAGHSRLLYARLFWLLDGLLHTSSVPTTILCFHGLPAIVDNWMCMSRQGSGHRGLQSFPCRHSSSDNILQLCHSSFVPFLVSLSQYLLFSRICFVYIGRYPRLRPHLILGFGDYCL